jgi:hypothetical protein
VTAGVGTTTRVAEVVTGAGAAADVDGGAGGI